MVVVRCHYAVNMLLLCYPYDAIMMSLRCYYDVAYDVLKMFLWCHYVGLAFFSLCCSEDVRMMLSWSCYDVLVVFVLYYYGVVVVC